MQEEKETKNNGLCFNTNMSHFQSYLLREAGVPLNLQIRKNETEQTENYLMYFNSLFSPKDTTQSLRKRNENLHLMNFDNSEQEPDQIYNRRRQKLGKLQKKQKTQLQELQEMRKINFEKFMALTKFMAFIFSVKNCAHGVRIDYYSAKTFYALTNSTEQNLKRITVVYKKMHQNVFNHGVILVDQSKKSMIESKILQFLIIPRFMISKEKIIRLIHDQTLQRNFQFLVQSECLGHYNNEANKKIPEEHQMQYVKELLKKPKGKQKFRKICSINHANKFLNKNGSSSYFELYNMGLQSLKYLESELKKGRKYATVKQQVPLKTDETENSQPDSQSSSGNKFSFSKMQQELNKMDNQNKSWGQNERMIDENQATMKKKRIMKHSSTPLEFTDKVVFKVKKSQTQQYQKNIIIVPPSHQI